MSLRILHPSPRALTLSRSNPDPRAPGRQRAREEDAEGRHRRVAGREPGTTTDILAVTPKDSADEQRQQHQRLGSPEADHSFLTAGPGGAGPGRSAARRQEHGVGPGSYCALMQEASEQEEEAGDPAAQRRSASSPPRRPL